MVSHPYFSSLTTLIHFMQKDQVNFLKHSSNLITLLLKINIPTSNIIKLLFHSYFTWSSIFLRLPIISLKHYPLTGAKLEYSMLHTCLRPLSTCSCYSYTCNNPTHQFKTILDITSSLKPFLDFPSWWFFPLKSQHVNGTSFKSLMTYFASQQ